MLTDSGGIQEETTVFGVLCLTIRKNTERPVTIEQGTNILVGNNRDRIVAGANKALNGEIPSGQVSELWDGKSAGRISEIIKDLLITQ